jgi:adenine-specific DNA-methyltransferase
MNIKSDENDEKYKYINQPMITYIGNKRKIIPILENVLNDIKKDLNKSPICFDVFSGSGVVSRLLKTISSDLYVNDIEYYSYILNKCFLINPTDEQYLRIKNHFDKMNEISDSLFNIPMNEINNENNIITSLYAPQNTNDIKTGERCFYTHENALIIDTLRKYIEDVVEPDIKNWCLAPLLVKSSINTNTSGVFKGFHKKNGIGHFGGKNEVALTRIMKQIKLDIPIFYNDDNKDNKIVIYQKDINILIDELINENIKFDIVYIDSPYNQHPYGSNYFMLNIIAKNEDPREKSKLSEISGIPNNWNKSVFNNKIESTINMKILLTKFKLLTKYIIISYSNEGFINFESLLQELNYSYEKIDILYDTYKGCRNIKKRNNKVYEYLYIVKF